MTLPAAMERMHAATGSSRLAADSIPRRCVLQLRVSTALTWSDKLDNILAYILRVVDEILFWDDDFVEKDPRLKTFLLSGMTQVRCRAPKLPMMTGTQVPASICGMFVGRIRPMVKW